LDLDVNDISLQGPAPKSEIPNVKSTERVPSPTVASNLPAMSVTKAPAPLPVRLPTARDIVSLPSPPPSQNPSLEDLESGRVNRMREVAEDVGLVTSTRKTGKVKSSHQVDGSDATASAIPTTPPPLISPTTSPAVTSATLSPNFPVLPDLLADLPSMGKEPIEPSPLAPEDPLINPDASRGDLLVEPTIRLVGGGGQVRVAEIPVASLNEEQPPLEATKDIDVASITPSETEAGSKPDEKLPKKSKSSLASLKRFSQLGRTIKKDSMSSLKGIISPQQNT
jgi:hypothetical protein